MSRVIRKPHPWLLPAMVPALMAGILLGSVSSSVWPGAAAVVLLLLALAMSSERSHLPLILLLTCAAGVVLGQLAWHPVLPEQGTYTVTGVVSDEVLQKDSQQIHTTLCDITLNGQPHTASAYWSFYAQEVPEGLVPGARVSFTASLYHPEGAENPGGFDFRSYLLQHGSDIGLYGQTDLVCTPDAVSLGGFIARIRHSLYTGLLRVMGDEAGGYAGAMLLGVRSGVTS